LSSFVYYCIAFQVLPTFPKELGLNPRRQQRKNLFWLVVE